MNSLGKKQTRQQYLISLRELTVTQLRKRCTTDKISSLGTKEILLSTIMSHVDDHPDLYTFEPEVSSTETNSKATLQREEVKGVMDLTTSSRSSNNTKTQEVPTATFDVISKIPSQNEEVKEVMDLTTSSRSSNNTKTEGVSSATEVVSKVPSKNEEIKGVMDLTTSSRSPNITELQRYQQQHNINNRLTTEPTPDGDHVRDLNISSRMDTRQSSLTPTRVKTQRGPIQDGSPTIPGRPLPQNVEDEHGRSNSTSTENHPILYKTSHHDNNGSQSSSVCMSKQTLMTEVSKGPVTPNSQPDNAEMNTVRIFGIKNTTSNSAIPNAITVPYSSNSGYPSDEEEDHLMVKQADPKSKSGSVGLQSEAPQAPQLSVDQDRKGSEAFHMMTPAAPDGHSSAEVNHHSIPSNIEARPGTENTNSRTSLTHAETHQLKRDVSGTRPTLGMFQIERADEEAHEPISTADIRQQNFHLNEKNDKHRILSTGVDDDVPNDPSHPTGLQKLQHGAIPVDVEKRYDHYRGHVESSQCLPPRQYLGDVNTNSYTLDPMFSCNKDQNSQPGTRPEAHADSVSGGRQTPTSIEGSRSMLVRRPASIQDGAHRDEVPNSFVEPISTTDISRSSLIRRFTEHPVQREEMTKVSCQTVTSDPYHEQTNDPPATSRRREHNATAR